MFLHKEYWHTSRTKAALYLRFLISCAILVMNAPEQISQESLSPCQGILQLRPKEGVPVSGFFVRTVVLGIFGKVALRTRLWHLSKSRTPLTPQALSLQSLQILGPAVLNCSCSRLLPDYLTSDSKPCVSRTTFLRSAVGEPGACGESSMDASREPYNPMHANLRRRPLQVCRVSDGFMATRGGAARIHLSILRPKSKVKPRMGPAGWL